MTVIGSLAVPPGTQIHPRKLLPKICVAGPLLFIVAVKALGIAAARACGLRHNPHGWTLHEELFVTLIRTLMTYGDIGVWRGFFREISNERSVLPALQVSPAERDGSRSLWFELKPQLRPKNPRGAVNLLFVHGGAFISGSCRQYQATYGWWLEELARRGISARLLSVSYPLAPEHPFPEGRDTTEDDVLWLLEHSGSTPVVVGGDSAGANLLLSALAHARDTGRLRTPPAGLCLISPCVDMTSESVFSRKDIGSVGQHDYLPKEKLNEGLPCCYTPDLTNPYVSPTLLESFDGLARKEFLLISGSVELMVPDIRRFAKKVEAAAAASSKRGGSNSGGGGGFRFAYQEEPGRVHSWPMLMLPHLRDKQEPFFAFVERSAGLQPASKA